MEPVAAAEGKKAVEGARERNTLDLFSEELSHGGALAGADPSPCAPNFLKKGFPERNAEVFMLPPMPVASGCTGNAGAGCWGSKGSMLPACVPALESVPKREERTAAAPPNKEGKPVPLGAAAAPAPTPAAESLPATGAAAVSLLLGATGKALI